MVQKNHSSVIKSGSQTCQRMQKKKNFIYFCIEKKHENQTKILAAVNCLK